MAEFKLERFKYNWRGNWIAGQEYLRDDIVRVNGKSYVCLLTHTANPAFRTDLNAILPGSNPPQPQPRWAVMTDGRQYLGAWEADQDYNLGDIVLYDGTMWLCTASHTSTSFAAGASNWTTFVKGVKFVGQWQPVTDYGHGAIVKYNGIAYKCLTAHTSSVTLEDNLADWEAFFDGIQYVSEWAPITVYRENDLVRYGPTIFRCTETHTSGSNDLDSTKFVVELPGSQNNGEWDAETYYNQGDIVKYGGYLYIAIENNYDLQPSLLDKGDSSASWIVLAKTNDFVGEWVQDAFYKTGDVVQRGGRLYLAKIDIGGPDFDGSTADYLDPDVWELLAPGQAWKRSWNVTNYYSVGDVVYHLGTAYICNFEHIAEYRNSPGDNGSGFQYWDTLIQAGLQGGLHDPGDLLTFGRSRETYGDTSTLGDTRVAITEPGEILSVSSDLEVFWRSFINDADVVYVSTTGKDAKGYGLTYTRPFRSVRYACEYVEDNYAAGRPVKIAVATGRYEELNPMSIPAGCVVMGDELRATVIACTPPKPDYQDDWQFVLNWIGRINNILSPILTNTRVTPSVGNIEPQVLTGDPADADDAVAVNTLFTDYINYVEARIEDGSIDPAMVGTNTPSTLYAKAAARLKANQDFIVEEIIAWMNVNYAAIGRSREKLSQDVNGLLRGVIKDLLYPGNHFTLLAARRYVNGVQGGQNDDLFYVRDTTGLRNCTVEGLTGTLNPPGVFELYQRPTGGACVSLDPGWGPDDNRTWIVNRSPYIQGVTNIGTACVGCKIDGALHNGGVKSMVTNDFTQVLSDGIGVWVTNNARAELVSMFTYYCQVGYLAENGGVIRAANGNNSYGKFGSISQGNDPTETPQEVLVNNRVNEAQVYAGFAGGATDQIFAFEYNNCGEEYTEATAEIIGSGSNAEIEFSDFRHKALFEARLINTTGSGSEGGAGYLIRQGFAQETADSRTLIKLSATDITQDEAEIVNMRLTIISGDGTGQYGRLISHNVVTRDSLIAKESYDPYTVDSTTATSSIVLNSIENLKVNDPIAFVGTVLGTGIQEKTQYYVESINALDNSITITDAVGNPALTSILTVASPIEGLEMFVLGWEHIIPGYPLNTSFNSTAQYRIEPRLTTAKPPYSASTFNFVAERDLKGIAFGGTTFTYTNLSNELGTAELLYEDLERQEAVFRVVREGPTYTVVMTDSGVGYAVGDTITINGQRVGGNTPTNDVVITVTEVTDDSSNSIVDFTFTGTPRGGRFVAIANPNFIYTSDNGTSWTEIVGDISTTWSGIANGNNRFVAIAYNDNRINFSYDGTNWTTRSLPSTNNWIDIAYGNGTFVIIAEGSNEVLYSTNGLTFTSTSIPDFVGGDSTSSQWQRVVYGQGKFIAISGSDRAVASSTDGVTWVRYDNALPNDNFDFAALQYGANRFLAITVDGRTVYSVNGGTVWWQGDDLPNDGISSYTWTGMRYSQGVFVAISKSSAGASNNVAATTEDGVRWTQRDTGNTQRWSQIEYATLNNEPTWVVLSDLRANNGIVHIKAGCQAKVRANVFQGRFDSVKIIDPGSNYDEINNVDITISDNAFTLEAEIENRLGNGVLAQPDFINRGSGYRTSTSTILITGDGYADIIPEDNVLTLSGVEVVPGPGVQIRIEGILDDTTDDPDDLKLFAGITIQDLGEDDTGNGTHNVRLTVSPRLRNEYNLAHGTSVTLRSRYSQCRISGHDFLDIGTGNFEETNYPEIYADGNYFIASPENEVYESDGGRVFYVSTDQDGNFRGGELFAVEQATGIVTISAEFFDLDGLSELALGGVRLGGSGTVVREFSTDPTFSEDSNNVVPTQRAIATFLANRLSVGGENLEVNSILAGRVQVGTSDNKIFSPAEQYVYFNAPVNITGGLDGQFLAQAYFFRNLND